MVPFGGLTRQNLVHSLVMVVGFGMVCQSGAPTKSATISRCRLGAGVTDLGHEVIGVLNPLPVLVLVMAIDPSGIGCNRKWPKEGMTKVGITQSGSCTAVGPLGQMCSKIRIAVCC